MAKNAAFGSIGDDEYNSGKTMLGICQTKRSQFNSRNGFRNGLKKGRTSRRNVRVVDLTTMRESRAVFFRRVASCFANHKITKMFLVQRLSRQK